MEERGLWRDTLGQYHARFWFRGIDVTGRGGTPVETLMACWQNWLESESVSDGPRPTHGGVSEKQTPLY